MCYLFLTSNEDKIKTISQTFIQVCFVQQPHFLNTTYVSKGSWLTALCTVHLSLNKYEEIIQFKCSILKKNRYMWVQVHPHLMSSNNIAWHKNLWLKQSSHTVNWHQQDKECVRARLRVLHACLPLQMKLCVKAVISAPFGLEQSLGMNINFAFIARCLPLITHLTKKENQLSVCVSVYQ